MQKSLRHEYNKLLLKIFFIVHSLTSITGSIRASATEQEHVLDVVTRVKEIQEIIKGYINCYELLTTIQLTHRPAVKRIMYDQAGSYFIIISCENTITFWDSKKLVAIPFVPKNKCLNAYPLSDYFLMIEKNELFLNNVTTGLPIRNAVKTSLNTRLIHASCLSHCATASRSTIQVWDILSLQCKAKLMVKKPIITIQCAPHNQQIAFSNNDCISIWDSELNTVTVLTNVIENMQWTQLAFSADGKLLIARSKDALSSWDLPSNAPFKSLKYNDGQFSHFAFLSQNCFAVTCSRNGSTNSKIIFIDTKSFTRLYTIDSTKIITSFDFSPDYYYLIAGTQDGLLQVYKNSDAILDQPRFPKQPYDKKVSATKNCCVVS